MLAFMRFGLKVSRLSGCVAAYHWTKSDRHFNYFNFGSRFVIYLDSRDLASSSA